MRSVSIGLGAIIVLGVLASPTMAGGFLGVYLGSDSDQAVVSRLVPNGPAAKAGIEPGDKIIAFGDRQIENNGQLRAALSRKDGGETIVVRVERNGKTLDFEVDLDASPNQPSRDSEETETEEPEEPREDVDQPEEQGAFLGIALADGEGVVVDSAIEGTAAAQAGLQEGDRIVRLAGQTIETSDDLVEVLNQSRPGQRVGITVERGDEQIELRPIARAGERRRDGWSDVLSPRRRGHRRRGGRAGS